MLELRIRIMALPKGSNPNRPQKGSSTIAEPIKDIKAIKRIKKILADHPRNFAIFNCGINFGLRANELLSMKVGLVNTLQVGDSFTVKEQKTGKNRRLTLNKSTYEAIQLLLESKTFLDGDYLFQSRTK
jgi:integrase